MDKKTSDKDRRDDKSKDEDDCTSFRGRRYESKSKDPSVGIGDGLSTQQEQLLMKFYDQECSLIEFIKARILLSRRSDAQLFLAKQGKVTGEGSLGSVLCSLEQGLRNIPGGSLWSNVSMGISQEKRLRSVSLGAIPREEPSELSNNWGVRLGWGISGATVAAGVIFIAVNIFDQRILRIGDTPAGDLSGPSVDGQLVLDRGVGVEGSTVVRASNLGVNERRMVVLEGAREGMPVRLVRAPRVKAPRSTAHVEWVRSNGKPTFIRDPRQGAPIIWIKRIPKVMIPSKDKSTRDKPSREWSDSGAVKQGELYPDFE